MYSMRSNDSGTFSNCCPVEGALDDGRTHQLENPSQVDQVIRKIATQSYRVEILAQVLMLLEMKLNAQIEF